MGCDKHQRSQFSRIQEIMIKSKNDINLKQTISPKIARVREISLVGGKQSRVAKLTLLVGQIGYTTLC